MDVCKLYLENRNMASNTDKQVFSFHFKVVLIEDKQEHVLWCVVINIYVSARKVNNAANWFLPKVG